jgi:hypothetical protein
VALEYRVIRWRIQLLVIEQLVPTCVLERARLREPIAPSRERIEDLPVVR